jgi:hypothetical protein
MRDDLQGIARIVHAVRGGGAVPAGR